MYERASLPDLIQRCLEAAGDEAWPALVGRLEPALRRGIHRPFARAAGAPSPDLVDDLVQETYCRLLAAGGRRLAGCRALSDGGVEAYMARVSERVAIDFLRACGAEKRGRDLMVAADVERLARDSEALPEDRLLIAERLARLLDLLARAAGGRRRRRNFKVLVLAFLAGLSSSEIAERLGRRLSASGVDSVVYRARRRLELAGAPLLPRRRAAHA